MKKLILSCFMGLIWSAAVVAAPSYEADVSVDFTASTVAEAKKKAMAKATRDGLNEVVLSISTAKGLEAFDKLTDNQLQHFIAGVMVLMEKSSDVRYIADLRISVNEEVLKAYIEENGLPLVAGEERDVLVIPLIEAEGGTADLWGDGNFWRQAFVERPKLKKGNLNIHPIEKNLGNITAATAGRMFDMSDGEYNELASFNRMEDIYVVKYSLKDGKIYVKDFPGRTVGEVNIDENAEPDAMIDKVLPFFKDVKREAMMEQNIVVQENFEVVYTYAKLGDWMRLKRLLESNPQVQDVNIISMANGKVHFSFVYGGVAEKLLGNLDANGFRLIREGKYYVVY